MSGYTSAAIMLVLILATGWDVMCTVKRERASAGFTTNVIDLVRAFGMAIICVWAVARLPVKLATAHTEPVHLLLHVGLLLLVLSIAARRVQRCMVAGGSWWRVLLGKPPGQGKP